MDEGVERLLALAKENEINDPILVEIDYSELDDVAQGVIQLDGNDCYMSDMSNYFPTEYSYRIPYGVVAAGRESDIDVDQIRPGFSTNEYDDDLVEIDAVIEEENLLDAFLSTIGLLSSIRCFWIKLHDDWEDAETEEIYVNESLCSVERIGTFIQQNYSDTYLNGHVSLTAYSDTGQTNVNLSDHKMLVVLTYDKSFAERVAQSLKASGIRELDELFSISEGVHHWHFRNPQASDRKELMTKLTKMGFTLWEQ